jgi:hypothetical protein
MERGSPILCPHSGPAKVRWVKEPPLRLEAYAMHVPGPTTRQLESRSATSLRKSSRTFGASGRAASKTASSSASVSFKGGISGGRLATAEALGTLLGAAPILPRWKPAVPHGSPVLSPILARGAEPKLGAEHSDLV